MKRLKRLFQKKIPVISILVVVLVIPLIVFLAIAGDSEKPGLPVGSFAPNIVGETLSGDVESLESQTTQGNWVVVNFFASKCPPCVKEHEQFIQLLAGSSNVQVFSILFNESERQGREFFETYGGNWPVFVKDTTRIALQYRILSVPETYLVTPAGQVVAHWRGAITADDIREQIVKVEDAIRARGGSENNENSENNKNSENSEASQESNT